MEAPAKCECDVGVFVYTFEYIYLLIFFYVCYVYKEREGQQQGWRLTFISPVHAASCVLTPLQLPPCPREVLLQPPPCWWDADVLAATTPLPPPLHVPLDMLCSSTQPGQQMKPAQGSPLSSQWMCRLNQGRRGAWVPCWVHSWAWL